MALWGLTNAWALEGSSKGRQTEDPGLRFALSVSLRVSRETSASRHSCPRGLRCGPLRSGRSSVGLVGAVHMDGHGSGRRAVFHVEQCGGPACHQGAGCKGQPRVHEIGAHGWFKTREHTVKPRLEASERSPGFPEMRVDRKPSQAWIPKPIQLDGGGAISAPDSVPSSGLKPGWSWGARVHRKSFGLLALRIVPRSWVSCAASGPGALLGLPPGTRRAPVARRSVSRETSGGPEKLRAGAAPGVGPESPGDSPKQGIGGLSKRDFPRPRPT